MTVDNQLARVLRLYPDDCQPLAVEPYVSPEGFSGAQLWRVTALRGPLCLRRWPAQHPTPERLEFIQAVLWHVDQEGFHSIPLPLETQHHHGFVRHAGHLWELTPWLPGVANYRASPSSAKLQHALIALAKFHRAAALFPLPETGPTTSPGLLERRSRLAELMTVRLSEIRSAVVPEVWPDLAPRAARLIALFAAAAPKVVDLLESAAQIRVGLQPCIRDVWHAHVLFVGEQVSGLVDFGSMRPENVAADIARLLGSLAGDNPGDWQQGLAAYQTVRRLSDGELKLMTTFDRSTVLMGGLQWLEWIYLERRTYADHPAVLARIDEFLSRLEKLTQTLG